MKNKCELNLLIGKPIDNPHESDKSKIATFTRFVLPFAYKLREKQCVKTPDLYYTLNPANDLSFIKRRKFFTRETAHILYDRSLWLDMSTEWEQTAWGQANVEIILRGKQFKIGMLPPRITLFEAFSGKIKDRLAKLAGQSQNNIQHTGFLQVDIFFSDNQEHAPELDDLLILNEFFRYYNMPWDAHEKIFKRAFGNIPAEYSISGSPKTVKKLGQLECYFERWANLLEIPLVHNGKQYQLFPERWALAARDWSYNKDTQNEHWQIYADNRTYVWTACFLKNGGEVLKTCFEPEKEVLQSYDYGHWIKLVNVDAPSFDFTSQSYKSPENTHEEVTQFERNWVKKRSYGRWEEKGTWYGFCYHAGAVLGPPYYNVFAPSRTYYFDTVMLLFFVRMTIFRFSRELSDIIMIDSKKDKMRTQLTDLRKDFARFTVLYRFPLVSNQQQMIELYKLKRTFFDVDNFFQEIQQEIDHTHELLELIEAHRLSKAANRLASWGIPLAAGGLVAALFSMADLNIWDCITIGDNCTPDNDRIFQLLLVVAFMVPVWTALNWKGLWKKIRNKWGEGK